MSCLELEADGNIASCQISPQNGKAGKFLAFHGFFNFSVISQDSLSGIPFIFRLLRIFCAMETYFFLVHRVEDIKSFQICRLRAKSSDSSLQKVDLIFPTQK